MNHAASGMRVCLDLGTAFSKACVFLGEDLAPRAAIAPLPLGAVSSAEHPLLTPSAMYVAENRIFFGPTAIANAREAGESRRLPILSFKMMLSAREIEPTLALRLSRTVDPFGVFCHRDALVLYLAHLDQLVRAAVAMEPDIDAAAADAPRRITSPLWRAREQVRDIVGQLIEESMIVSALLGASLIDAAGVPLEVAKAALGKAAGQPGAGCFGGVVFEAQSAASAYLTYATSRARHLLVIDMGAGTTDIAGFERSGDANHPALLEITEAQQWCSLAGDELDGIIIDLFLRASGERRRDEERRLWRTMRLSVHRLKRDLFAKGKAVFEHGRKRIVVQLATLERDPSFRAFCRALVRTFADGMRPVASKAQQAGANSICVLLAGGGSSLPFLSSLVQASARPFRGLKAEIEPFGANWSLPHKHHPFAGAFPQMAISIGGALAEIRDEPALAA
jgi:hypothetical protein